MNARVQILICVAWLFAGMPGVSHADEVHSSGAEMSDSCSCAERRYLGVILDRLQALAPECHHRLGVPEYRAVMDRLPRARFVCDDSLPSDAIAGAESVRHDWVLFDRTTARAHGRLLIRINQYALVRYSREQLVSSVLHELLHFGANDNRADHNTSTAVDPGARRGCTFGLFRDRVYFLADACGGIQ
jgi:hypothetical protein